ncbi:MAG: phospho-N-acetylmuramoyl-pentapeptide-transferase, partial [Clostridia bacterium]|nr:phospho-N-acetylmuramoyl-pentapeptide-transferase [Clostridia bacterium]
IGPSWHKAKEGTPTLGGLSFLLSVPISLLVTLLVFRQTLSYEVTLVLLYALSGGLIGLIDDGTKLKHRKNLGLLPWQKLFLQTLFALFFLFLFHRNVTDLSLLPLPFFRISLSLGFFSLPLLTFLLVGTVNCANLTDGIDGLAGTVSLLIALFFLFEGVQAENTGVIALSASLAGGLLGFLLFNRHPARIFMGDTGSLFLGAILSVIPFLLASPLVMVVSSLVFIVEGVSVVLQVLYFKKTGKRIFKMAPYHHHLEKCGWSEGKIVLAFAALTLLSVLFAHFALS